MDGEVVDTSTHAADDLPALVERLGQALSSPPMTDNDRRTRAVELNLLMAGIDEYGVDAAALLRFGIKDLAWLPVMVLLIVTPESERNSATRAMDFDGWLACLGLNSLPILTAEQTSPDEPTLTALQRVVEIASQRLPHWVDLAPIEHILDLTPPAPALIEDVATAVPSEDVVDAYRWLWERYGRPGFDNWTPSSLRREYLWREGDWTPPFPAAALVVDRSEDSSLHHEIARRYVASPLDNGDTDLLPRLQEQALQFLKQHRWSEAAALFEFYLQQEPDNHTARNNLGFCLLPLDPSIALTHLESVERAAHINRTMLAHNICTALAALGREPEALDKAEYHWQRDGVDDPIGAYLWRRTDTGFEVYHAPDPRLALAELGLALSSSVGATARVSRWEERVANLQGHSV